MILQSVGNKLDAKSKGIYTVGPSKQGHKACVRIQKTL